MKGRRTTVPIYESYLEAGIAVHSQSGGVLGMTWRNEMILRRRYHMRGLEPNEGGEQTMS
jgi:hypothetical protein